eukprot:Protomagalhaensia_sp_Gyna_25__5635@NODE_78_length_5524_cov_150_417320_g59_i0_p1_GENE_NODE_78_length_5524_cov_150_417320_g59_i0NODE_78_length_5524_cov_150_417320_g59_i0_p1_ORF_typecomplete_len475_score86_15Nucleoside_tran/PF01733_18/1_8e03Nucleoside_tran/PF01733_18/1_4e30DUF1229/PF06797_11/7_7DUF1229/PF06797_11/6_7_NODE_78_length_5524_cov_150_417320_g59_i013482772
MTTSIEPPFHPNPRNGEAAVPAAAAAASSEQLMIDEPQFESLQIGPSSGSDNKGNKAPTMSDREARMCTIVFIFLGCGAMYFWNSVLNTIYSVVAVQYPEYPRLADTVTSTYSTVSFLTAMVLSMVGPLNRWLNLAGGAGMIAAALLYPVVTLHTAGFSGATGLHILAVGGAVADTCFQVSGYAYAVILPRQFGGWVSFGYGISGVVTFSLWMMFSQGIFDINRGDFGQLQKAVWGHTIIAAGVCIFAVTAFHLFSRMTVAKEAILRTRRVPEFGAPTDDCDAETSYSMLEEEDRKKSFWSKARQYWLIFQKTWGMQVGMAVLMGMSMMAYPLIGPYRWGRSFRENDVLTGVFQVCDFTGRYIPNMSWLMSWLLIPGWLVLPLTIGRGVLLGLFIWIAKNNEGASNPNGILQNYGTQITLMFALAITHGWYASVYMTRIPEGVTHPKDKAKASAMGVSLLIFMIAVGLWLAKAV